MPCVVVCGVFAVYCVAVYLLAVRFHILKENSSMKMNLKRKGIRYNKLFFFFLLSMPSERVVVLLYKNI